MISIGLGNALSDIDNLLSVISRLGPAISRTGNLNGSLGGVALDPLTNVSCAGISNG